MFHIGVHLLLKIKNKQSFICLNNVRPSMAIYFRSPQNRSWKIVYEMGAYISAKEYI